MGFNFYKFNLYMFLAYLLSLFFSSLDFLDFKNFEILGDRATQHIVKIILIICIVSSFGSFLFFHIKNENEKTDRSDM